MRIEVAYAEPASQTTLILDVPRETTALQAIALSGILTRYPHLARSDLSIGIFSKPCSHDHHVQEGDRVEIYRPLIADPKEARRTRAARK